jgi:peptide/nickel transport system substrate-binding protein
MQKRYLTVQTVRSYVAVFAIPALAVLAATSNGQTGTPAPVRGGTLTVAMNVEPALLDPTQGAGAEIVRMMHQNVLEGLMGFSETGKVIPALAAQLPSISKDRLEYTIKLRKNVKFHDGSAFSSSDVKANFDRAKDPKSGHTSPTYYENIASVSAPDANTVVIKLAKPNNEFLYTLARSESIIEPEELIATADGLAKLKTNPIGTGPFKLGTWTRGSSIKIDRNADYYISGLPYLDSVNFRFLGDDQNAKVAGLRSGDLDVIGYNVPAEQVANLKADPNIKVYSGPSSGEITVSLNNKRKPFDNLDVRRAFTYAMNKKEIVDGAFFGQGTVIGSFNSPGQPYYVDLSKKYPYNPETAQRLLKKAGVSNLKVKFTVANEFPIERRTAEVYAAQLAKVGVTAEIELVPFNTWIQKVFLNKDYDMTIIGHAESFDLDRYARDGYYFNWDNTKFKALYDRALVTGSNVERNQLYVQMQYLLAEQAPGVWAFSAPYIAATRANVYGWQPIAVSNLSVVKVFKTK